MYEEKQTNAKLLHELSDISDEELQVLLNKTIYDYRKNKKMQLIISDIIYDLGYYKRLPINYELENKYKIITKIAGLRSIIPTKKIEKIIITREDVIKELHEMSEREVKWVDDHSYLYDVYFDGLEDNYNDTKTKKLSIDKMTEIKEFYQEIISSVTEESRPKIRK